MEIYNVYKDANNNNDDVDDNENYHNEDKNEDNEMSAYVRAPACVPKT